MKLEPVEGDASHDMPRIALSERSRKLAHVQEATVEKRSVSAEIRMVGKVVFDETRLAHVTARVDGRIDRLFADFTGMRVEKDDHLAYLYSPELLSAQEELIQGIRLKNTSLSDAAREKLSLLGVTPQQIASIEKKDTADDHMTIYSPISGVVVGKDVVEGTYIKTGSRMYTIADLSHLWIRLDAHESDIALVRYGQKVTLAAESYPGRIFKGTVAFVDPVLNEMTRTVGVRVNVANSDGALKPGMFVRSTISAELNALGEPLGIDLSGKWICPMHPEDLHDKAGTCRICEMPLKKAEDTEYASGPTPKTTPLVIPTTAPLITGKRAVVYVGTENEGEYEGQEVTLGRRAGDYYVVLQGLNEGDRVVVKGNFRIDSALQIMGKPSMMGKKHASSKKDQSNE
jgi:Cu(I)/Ag(I) efflux system membrane fusion protein